MLLTMVNISQMQRQTDNVSERYGRHGHYNTFLCNDKPVQLGQIASETPCNLSRPMLVFTNLFTRAMEVTVCSTCSTCSSVHMLWCESLKDNNCVHSLGQVSRQTAQLRASPARYSINNPNHVDERPLVCMISHHLMVRKTATNKRESPP